MNDYWLKPIMIVLALFAFVYLLMTLGSSWDVTWTDINPTIISLLPWLVALIIGLSVFVYIMGKK